MLLELQSKLYQFEYGKGKIQFESKEKMILKLTDENEYLKNQILDKEELSNLLSQENERNIEKIKNETDKKLALKDKIIEENERKISE